MFRVTAGVHLVVGPGEARKAGLLLNRKVWEPNKYGAVGNVKRKDKQQTIKTATM